MKGEDGGRGRRKEGWMEDWTGRLDGAMDGGIDVEMKGRMDRWMD